MQTGKSAFRLTADAIDPEVLRASMADPGAGAFVAFEGRVRRENAGRQVVRLEYEAAGAPALAEGRAILREALAKFAALEVLCVHRTGSLAVGEIAVWIGVTAAHRDVAFEACRYLIEQLKTRIPIWKKEHYSEGPPAWINHP